MKIIITIPKTSVEVIDMMTVQYQAPNHRQPQYTVIQESMPNPDGQTITIVYES